MQKTCKLNKRMDKIMKNKKPVILITGYLGSGKTTLLNELLKQEKRQIAVVVNDMGSVNVDAEFLKKNGSKVAQSQMYELQNGCICCTLRDEFINQMEVISDDDVSQAVFVEASGISDPGAIAASFLGYEDENPNTNVYLSSIVTVVDADRIYHEFIKDMENFDEEAEFSKTDPSITTLIIDQIEFCNTIILNKCDLLSEEQVEKVVAVIRNFQSRAKIIKTSNANVDPDLILTNERFDYDQVDSSSAIQRAMDSLDENPAACYEEFGIKSFLYENKRPFNRQKFNSFLQTINPEMIIRAKGYMWFSDADKDVQLFESAGRNASITEVAYWVAALPEAQIKEVLNDDLQLKQNWDKKYGDRINQLIFIGKGYDEAKIKTQLSECLDA